jgi:hypothetical protein
MKETIQKIDNLLKYIKNNYSILIIVVPDGVKKWYVETSISIKGFMWLL